jgi:hypothetical protein
VIDAETGAKTVREIFNRVRNCDPALVDLYAEDGVCVQRDAVMNGRKEIFDYYAAPGGVYDTLAPKPQIKALACDPPYFITVLEVAVRDGKTVHAIDLIEVNDEGLVKRLVGCQQLPPE